MATDNHSGVDLSVPVWLRWVPKQFLPFAHLARWDRPIGIWLLLLPSYWGIALGDMAGGASWPLYLLFFLGAVAMRGAGCTINDILDRKLDAQVARTATRPLAAGACSVRAAWVWLAAQLLVGLLVWAQLPLAAQLAALAVVPLIFLYPLAKRVTWWPQAVLGIVFNSGVIIGALATGAALTSAVILLYLGAVLWTVGYDTIYATQDVTDDAVVGVKSTARLFGARTPQFVYAFYTAAFLCWVAAGLLGSHNWLYYFLLISAKIYAGWLLYMWRGDTTKARRAFINNQYLGLVIWLALLVN